MRRRKGGPSDGKKLRERYPVGSDDGKTLSSPGPGAEKDKESRTHTYVVYDFCIFLCSRDLLLFSSVRVGEFRTRFMRRLAAHGDKVASGIQIFACSARVIDNESCKLVRVSRCDWLSLCISASTGLEVEVPLHKIHLWNR